MTLSHYRRVAQVHMSCCVQFVDIPTQPMHPTAGTRWEFGAGDQRSSIAELAPARQLVHHLSQCWHSTWGDVSWGSCCWRSGSSRLNRFGGWNSWDYQQAHAAWVTVDADIGQNGVDVLHSSWLKQSRCSRGNREEWAATQGIEESLLINSMTLTIRIKLNQEVESLAKPVSKLLGGLSGSIHEEVCILLNEKWHR